MIKINLLKQPSRGQTLITQASMTNFSAGGLPPELVKKLIVFALPVLTVFSYDTFNNFSYSTDLKKIEKNIKDLKEKITGMQPKIEEAKKLQNEKKKLTEQIELMRGLSLKRYRTLKVFDVIQNLIPTKAWLMKLDISDEQVTIEGHSSDDLAISGFMESLEQSAYFKDVTWVDSHDVKQDKGDVVKFFKIKLSMEKL